MILRRARLVLDLLIGVGLVDAIEVLELKIPVISKAAFIAFCVDK